MRNIFPGIFPGFFRILFLKTRANNVVCRDLAINDEV